MNGWRIAWLLMGLLAAGVEIAGLLGKGHEDTLSEIVWPLALPVRIMIAIGLIWLGYHFVFKQWTN